ncbi:porin [Tamilnaduibacter salinus]|uniref:Porin n=1 Tax=Tamilnaduibacter salinus TaxID=1484056 RepID=A0A2A2I399_9GAMM|nr:porin [Tamilnaduibacter salinus]PAV25888.1 porin [Tamilnaduibacter salinus]
MKKTLIASAVAAATFSGSAAAMTSEQLTNVIESMPTLYGNIQLVNRYVDSDVTGGGGQLDDNGSTIGVKHESEVAPGITAFGKLELEGIQADDKGDGQAGLTDLDEAYLGVKGEKFGQVWVGSDDSQYESLIGDYSNWVYEVGLNNLTSSFTTGEGDLVQYVSPNFGGLTLHGAVQVNGEADTGADNSYPYQLGAKYTMDALTVAVAMDSNDSAADASNENSYGLSVEYALDNLVLDAFYDFRSATDNNLIGGANNFDFAESGQNLVGVMGTYTLGANSFRLSYEFAEADATGDERERDVITLQAKHNVNGNMYVYAEALQRNNEDVNFSEEVNELNVGAVYYF